MRIRQSQNYFIVKVLEDLNGGDDMDWQFMLYASGDLVDGNDPKEVLIAWVAISKSNGRMMRP